MFSILRAGRAWRGAFFLGALRVLLGTPEDSDGCDEEDACGLEFGFCRRELKEDINSIDWGDSPNRLLKWSAASCLESVAA